MSQSSGGDISLGSRDAPEEGRRGPKCSAEIATLNLRLQTMSWSLSEK